MGGRGGWRKRLAAYGGLYVLFCAGLALLQRRLLYMPQRVAWSRAGERFAQEGLAAWPPGAAYRGLMKAGVPEAALTRGTVLVFHGNAGSALDREPYCGALNRLGWRVILAEYPGYGARGGRPGEARFREDGRETARLVRRHFPGPLVILGESLGCGVAAAIAADPTAAPDALVLATPWDRLENVAARHYPWLPVRLLLRDRYDSVAYLQAYAGPVTVLLAERDEIIPASSTLALFAALPYADRKRLLRIPEATHNEWFWRLEDACWRELLGQPQGL